MRIIVVDDHEIVRAGLVATLGSDPDIQVVAAIGTAREAIEALPRLRPDVAVLDLRLPDMPGTDLCRELIAAHPTISVVMLSTYLSEESVRASLAAGAGTYVTKSAGLAKLRETLKQLAGRSGVRGDAVQAYAIAGQLHRLATQHAGPTRATPQQQRVLELAAQGLTNREVGERLFITESTVRFHIQRLKELLDAKTKAELVAKAMRSGMIEFAPEDLAGHEQHDDSADPRPALAGAGRAD